MDDEDDDECYVLQVLDGSCELGDIREVWYDNEQRGTRSSAVATARHSHIC